METITTLLERNRRITSLCDQVDSGDASPMRPLRSLWLEHVAADEDVVFPRLAGKAGSTSALVTQSRVDHRLVGRLLTQLATTTTDDAEYFSKVLLLARLVREHIVSEERSAIPLLDDEAADAPRAFEVDDEGAGDPGAGDPGASSDGDASWAEDPQTQDPGVDRDVQSVIRRTGGT